jgi:hypothetical protein
MPWLAKIRTSAAEDTEPATDYSLEIAAALLAVAIVFTVGAQLIFAFTHALP